VADDAADPKSEDRVAEGPADPVAGAINALRAAMDDLTSQVAREHDRAKARETVIDRLHSDAQRLRAGEGRELLRPVLADLRRLRDDLLGQARSVPAAMSSGNMETLLESYADSVMMILERHGVIAVRPTPGTAFDPRRHRATGITATSEHGADGLIATVLGDGYEDADTGAMIASARVTVYRHAGTGEPDGQDG
jgi:molecular chaperone GrpE